MFNGNDSNYSLTLFLLLFHELLLPLVVEYLEDLITRDLLCIVGRKNSH